MPTSVFYAKTTRLLKIMLFGLLTTLVLGISPFIPESPFYFFPLLLIPFTIYAGLFPMIALAKKRQLVINDEGLFDSISILMPSQIFWNDVRRADIFTQRNQQLIEVELKSLRDVLAREPLVRNVFLTIALFDHSGKVNRVYIDPTMFGTTGDAILQQIRAHLTT